MKNNFPFNASLLFLPSRGLAFFGQWLTLLVVLGIFLLFPHFTHAGFWDKALTFGNNLLATAAGNYAQNYQQDLSQLLQALRQPGTVNQPLFQGITPGNMPGNPYDPNVTVNQNPYGQSSPYGSNPGYGYQYDGQDQGYSQGNQQGGYDNQPPGSEYPTDPNYGNVPLNNTNPYPQDQAYDDTTNPYESNTQNEGYEQNPAAYPQNPQYSDASPSQGYNDPYDPQYAQTQYQQPAPPPYPTEPFSQQPNDPNTALEQGIQLDVAIVKRAEINGTETLLPINDGDVLKDGRGNAQAGEKFRIMFRANSHCYVYVIAIDGSAWAQGIFPSLTTPFANPVKPGQQYIIPENNNWLSLDQFKGIETLFFVASPDKRQDIEDLLASIAGKERHPKATPQQVTEAPIIPAGYHRSQPSSTPFIIGQKASSPQGQDQGLIPTTYFTQKAGEALRITRWFRHE